METSDKYSISGLLVWIAILFFYPIIGQTLDLVSVLSGAVFIVGAWSLGILVLFRVESINLLRGIVKDGIAILLGTVAMFWIYFMFSESFHETIFYAFSISLFLGVLALKRVTLLNIDLSTLITIVIVIIFITIIRESSDLLRSYSEGPIRFRLEHWDPIYSTSIVASLRFGVLEAIYQVGTPLNDQLGSYFAPAVFSASTDISSHISLYGCWMPFYKILGYLTITEFVLKIAATKYSLWHKPLIVLLFFFLPPLHPEYLLKLDVEKFIWLGTGYVLPQVGIPLTMSFVWISIIGIIVFYRNTMKYNFLSGVLMVALISLLLLVKIPMYFPFTVFLGVIAIYQAMKRNYDLFIVCFFSLLVSVVFYYFNYTQDGQTEVTFSFGWILIEYAALLGSKSMWMGLAVISSMMLIWGGIRYLGLFLLVKSDNQDNNNKIVVLATVISLGASLLMCMIVKILYLDESGAVLYDGTFDIEQFLKCAFGLLGIVTIAGFISIFDQREPRRLFYFSLVLCIVWSGLALASIVKRDIEMTLISTKWYDEVTKEMLALKPKLSVINSSNVYSGQYLTATDLGKFWVSTVGKEGGYNLSTLNSWRWKVMDQCLSTDSSIQTQAYKTLIDNEVDVIIASPETKDQLALFAKYNKLEFPPGKWLIQLQPSKR
ncbi:MAG TPA: hypothetical protein EYN69_10355 [Flavobacteriales bacterium]|nr:hypothetical protein [Flavobacteriales bacterium]